MKKLLFFVILSVTSLCSAMAQKNPTETVYLKNGSVVKGEIVEQIPNTSIKLKTRDGNLFVFRMEEIERITREEKASTPLRGRLYNGSEFSLAPSLTIANGAAGFGFGLGVGRRYSENFYWGMNLGLPLIGKDFSTSLSTTFRPILPIQNTNLDLYVDLVAGISVTSPADGRLGIAALNLQIIPGMQYPLSNYTDFRIGAGYAASILLDGGEGTSGAFILQAAFSFHSSTAESNAQQATIPSGLQITLESGFGVSFDGGGMMPTSIVAGYKLDSKWSLGIGWQRTYCFTGEFKVDNYYDGNLHNSWQPGIFLRGQYSFRETGGSPFISLDLGGSVLHVNEDHWLWENEDISSEFGINLYAAPAVGWSWKLGANSTLDLKAGVTLATRSSGKYTFTPWRESTRTEDCHYNPSNVFVKLSYTQTLNLLTGHGEKMKQKMHLK